MICKPCRKINDDQEYRLPLHTCDTRCLPKRSTNWKHFAICNTTLWMDMGHASVTSLSKGSSFRLQPTAVGRFSYYMLEEVWSGRFPSQHTQALKRYTDFAWWHCGVTSINLLFPSQIHMHTFTVARNLSKNKNSQRGRNILPSATKRYFYYSLQTKLSFIIKDLEVVRCGNTPKIWRSSTLSGCWNK